MLFFVRIQISDTTQDVCINLPQSATIQDLKNYFEVKYKCNSNFQTYYFMGRALEPHETLKRCGVTTRDFVLLHMKNSMPSCSDAPTPIVGLIFEESFCPYFKVGDAVEVRDIEYGAWWDAVLIEILLARSVPPVDKAPVRIYRVRYERDSLSKDTHDFKLEDIRWRSCHKYNKSELKEGMTVLVNYNLENPDEIGYWYDFRIARVERNAVVGTLYKGLHFVYVDIKLKSFKRIMKIEPSKFVSHRTDQEKSLKRPVKLYPKYCDVCDDKGDFCDNCGCQICMGRHGDSSIILCDACGLGYHMFCLAPALETVPAEEWFCPECLKQPVMSFSEIEISLNRSSDGGGKRQCTIVPRCHFGSIPGVPVGICWKLRSQLSQAGVHRKLVSAIHGAINSKTQVKGAYSILLSGRNDRKADFGQYFFEDYGEYFFHASVGGKLANGRRLVGGNLALAYNCNAKLDHKYGTKARNWKAGKPVRVVRSSAARSFSDYTPVEGYRYDGIYKVVGYRPVLGNSGYYVWMFHLRRDDPRPAPWAEGGEEFPAIYPSSFLEKSNVLGVSMSSSEATLGSFALNYVPTGRSTAYSESVDSSSFSELEAIFAGTSGSYKQKYFGSSPYARPATKNQIPNDIQRYIVADNRNAKLWDDCLQYKELGVFTQKLNESFACGCCYELLYKPVTTQCSHNFCYECLVSWFKEGTYNCPHCRQYLGQKKKLVINFNLQKALSFFFKGYELYRV